MPSEPVYLDSNLVARAREASGDRDVASYVEEAVNRALENSAFDKLLDELEAEAGAVPDDLLAEADRFWPAS